MVVYYPLRIERLSEIQLSETISAHLNVLYVTKATVNGVELHAYQHNELLYSISLYKSCVYLNYFQTSITLRIHLGSINLVQVMIL